MLLRNAVLRAVQPQRRRSRQRYERLIIPIVPICLHRDKIVIRAAIVEPRKANSQSCPSRAAAPVSDCVQAILKWPGRGVLRKTVAGLRRWMRIVIDILKASISAAQPVAYFL